MLTNRKLAKETGDLLIRLGCPPNLTGYGMLITAMQLMASDPEKYRLRLCGKLYPDIAEVHDSSPHRVERNIRSAIERMFDNADPADIATFCGYAWSPMRGKQTNAEFLFTLAKRVESAA